MPHPRDDRSSAGSERGASLENVRSVLRWTLVQHLVQQDSSVLHTGKMAEDEGFPQRNRLFDFDQHVLRSEIPGTGRAMLYAASAQMSAKTKERDGALRHMPAHPRERNMRMTDDCSTYDPS
eukprot:6828358-Prymnesium_polylepis.1